MGKTNELTGLKLDKFLTDMSVLVEALPSPDAKAKINRDLASLIEFLQDFRDRLKSLPTDNDLDGVVSKIEAVRDSIRIAEADPTMSRILGLSSGFKRPRKSTKNSTAKQNLAAAKSIAVELRCMPPGDIEQVLADKRKYNAAILRQIGDELGISLSSRSTRPVMIEKITKTLANRWGYDYLSNGGVTPGAPPEMHDR